MTGLFDCHCLSACSFCEILYKDKMSVKRIWKTIWRKSLNYSEGIRELELELKFKCFSLYLSHLFKNNISWVTGWGYQTFRKMLCCTGIISFISGEKNLPLRNMNLFIIRLFLRQAQNCLNKNTPGRILGVDLHVFWNIEIVPLQFLLQLYIPIWGWWEA